MTNTYVHADLSEMHLYPCAYSTTWNVTQTPGEDRLTLNMVLNQRSQDVLAANNWNVCQYAILLMMVAQSCNMIPGELLHVIADAHIYDRHVDVVKELIGRETYPAPKVSLNPGSQRFLCIYHCGSDRGRLSGRTAGEKYSDRSIITAA